MLKDREISERWLIIGIAILMLLALGILAKVLSSANELGGRTGLLMLDRATANQEQRIRLIADSYAWNLVEQADQLRAGPAPSDSTLLHRWLPLLANRYAIRSIGIINDHGSAVILHHADSLWRFTTSTRNGLAVVDRQAEWPLGQDSIPPSGTVANLPDPRGSAWFSRALEDRQHIPVWTAESVDGGPEHLALSYLVRTITDSTSFSVIFITVDAAKMLTAANAQANGAITAQFNANWQLLGKPDTAGIGDTWEQALAKHAADHPLLPFRLDAGGRPWIGNFSPVELNGLTLYSGVLMDNQGIESFNRARRLGLWLVLGLLLLLGLMLLIVFLQSRSAARRELRQARRSKVQARHLAKAIGEREMLDREVHHRVKNNLQVVSSLLNLQAQRIPGAEARQEFLRGKRRIDSIALVHHKLYRQNDLSAVDLGVFLNDITKAMAAMFDPESRTVSHSVDAHGIRCDADSAIQLGMLFCELLANCHQHAFPYATGGHISISVKATGDDELLLVVQDNGQGFDPDAPRENTLGLELVEALAEQLDGSCRILHDGGTRVEVTFRAKVAKPLVP